MPKPIKTNLETLLQAWDKNDPTAVFSGMTLEQFRTATAPAVVSRAKLSQLKQESRAAIAARQNADRVANEDYLRVVNAIRGSEMHGENSPFYRALGYKTRNERKTGKKAQVPSLVVPQTAGQQ